MDKFTERMPKEEQKERGVKEGEEILGYYNVTVSEKDNGEIVICTNRCGFWPDQMEKHLTHPHIKLLRDLAYALENRRTPSENNKDGKYKMGMFDFTIIL